MSERRLLVFDDDPQIGRVIQMIAEPDGFATRVVSEPDAFFAAVAQWAPTHIALDLVMPDMDGVEVLVKLAELDCRARLIITSGVGSRVLDAAGRSAAEHGLDIAGVLSKPFTPGTLRALLAAPPAPGEGAPAAGVPAPRAGTTHFQVTVEELREAIAGNQLTVVYQPKIECAGGKLAGFEALVRWLHPEWGVVMPDRFVPLAERHGLIDALTEAVLDQSMAWLAQTFPDGSGAVPRPLLSVNISARSLQDVALVERVSARCRQWSVEPHRLIFELTETAAMEDPVVSLDLLTRLRVRGFQLSIDDFGTGYSSMIQLVRLPFSEIKIDKSFVITAANSAESRTVVRSVVELGRSLGLRTTAEGVEDAETLRYLTGIGCHLAQGYHIGRPMPPEAVTDWLGRAPAQSPPAGAGHGV